MRIKLGRITFDPQEGFGATPNQMELEYRGFAVVMSPRNFLRLVPALGPGEGNETIVSMGESLSQGRAVGPPFLTVDFRDEHVPTVLDHEGRHRALACSGFGERQQLLVHIFPSGGDRARHLTVDRIQRFRDGARSQDRGRRSLIPGPLFASKIWFHGEWTDLDNLAPQPLAPTGTPVLAAVERRLAIALRKQKRI